MAEAPLNQYQFLRSSARFARMRARGAIQPPFAVIQVVTELVEREYRDVVAQCVNAAVQASASVGKSLAGVQDAGPDEDLTKHLINALKERLKKYLKAETLDQTMIGMLAKQLWNTQMEFFREMQEDADEETQARIVSSFSRDESFAGRLDGLREGYLKTAVERITEGKSNLRKQFIKIFGDWIEGRAPDLPDMDALIVKLGEEAGTFSRFFARDQFSRFNKALTVAMYEEAGAEYIQWLTVMDARVRPTHRALQGKIFRIDDLPKEYLDYLCRCSFIPVYNLKGRTVTRGDGISLAA